VCACDPVPQASQLSPHQEENTIVMYWLQFCLLANHFFSPQLQW